MRQSHNRNRRGAVDEAGNLVLLANTLKRIASQKGPSQQEIEKATGVDQTTISRAKNGKLRRVTEKIRCLMRYANMQAKDIILSEEVQRTARSFLAVGGTEDELLGSIRHATSIVLRHTKG